MYLHDSHIPNQLKKRTKLIYKIKKNQPSILTNPNRKSCPLKIQFINHNFLREQFNKPTRKTIYKFIKLRLRTKVS